MADPFDPYQTWFGIPPNEQPPDHYRLLGIQRFEKRLELIEAAAISRLDDLQPHRAGPNAKACQKIIAEISAARICLTNENRRAVYDAGLYRKVATSAVRVASGDLIRRISAEEFLDILEAKDLVSPAMLQTLRSQCADQRTFTPAENVVRILLAQGLLTRALADRLMETAAGGKLPDQKLPFQTVAPGDGNEDLTFAPEPSQAATVKSNAQTPASSAANSISRPAPSVPEIVDRGAGAMLEDPTLGGALSARTPKLLIPRKKGWFSWLRLPSSANTDDTWIVWLGIVTLVGAILFFAVLIWSLTRSHDDANLPESKAPVVIEIR